MEMYMTDLSNPMYFVGRTLAELYHTRAVKDSYPLLYGGMFDEKLFSHFHDQFNCISITSGLPKNDYGQTVQLSKVETVRDLNELEWRTIPEHLIGPNFSLKQSEVTGRFGYKRNEYRHHDQLFVEECFFFEFQPEYSLKTFSKLNASLAALRYLSTVLHKLKMFKVVLCNNGVFVKIRANVGDSYKPEFIMGS